MKVLIGPSSFAALDESPIKRLREAGCEVIDNPYKRRLTKQELLDLLGDDVVGLIAGLETLDREVMTVSNLKVISRVGVGLSNVDLDAAKELGVTVEYTPDGPTQAVAELTLGSCLSLMRMISKMDSALHGGKWEKCIGTQLAGKTVAVIGYGRIGRRVAELMKPFGVNILVVDPYLTDGALPDARLVSLEKALSEADVITLHNSGEDCLLGSAEFKKVKKGAYILNAARGSVISEDGLGQALEDGTVAGAWLDTYEDEPYTGKLCGHERVLLTPHVGSYTRECREKMENEAVSNLLKSLGGKE